MNYGVVAEFNPFHNGHKHLIDSLKTDSDSTVTAVMSESFVQRGECSVLSPKERAKVALLNGADLVVSLPVQYAISSAERFSYAGVKILSSMGFIDYLGFGSECADSVKLSLIAKTLLSDDFPLIIKDFLAKGLSYPKSRELALEKILGDEYSSIIKNPNDILGVEYIKALLKLKSSIKPFPVERVGVCHDSKLITDGFASASYIRECIKNKESFSGFLPVSSYEILKENLMLGKAPADFKNLETAVVYKLRTMTLEDFKELPDVSEGLEYKFYNAVKESSSLNEILEKIKSKRYTHSRIRRIILYAFLGVTKKDVSIDVPYIRVLGFNKKGAELLKIAKEKATLPIVTKYSDISLLCDEAKRTFYLESKARDVFGLALPKVDPCGKVMTDKIIVL